MIKEIVVKQALEKEGQPDGSYVITIDAYDGCQLRCPYCWQRNNICWSKDIFVRTNIAEKLSVELETNQNVKYLYIGSLSDPYMDLEKQYHLTQKCLKVLAELDKEVYITTKSNNKLILEDIALLKSFKVPVTVLMGLSNLKEQRAGGASINIQIANKLHEEGIKVQAFLTPILPYVSKVDEIITSIHPEIPIYLDKLRIMTEGKQDALIMKWIQKEYPELAEKYNQVLYQNDESYYQQILGKYKSNNMIKFMFEIWGK